LEKVFSKPSFLAVPSGFTAFVQEDAKPIEKNIYKDKLIDTFLSAIRSSV